MNKYHKTRKFRKGDVCTFQSFGRYKRGIKDGETVTVQADEDNGVVLIQFKEDDKCLVSFMYLELQNKTLRFEVVEENWSDETHFYGNKLVVNAVNTDNHRVPLIDILIPEEWEGLTKQEAVGLSEKIIEVLKSFPL